MDHEKLDVYQVSLEFCTWAYCLCKNLSGVDRHARDQLLRASQSIVLNIAEGCGRTGNDRKHFYKISSGSARECGAIIDILERTSVIHIQDANNGKSFLNRLIAMLTKMQSLL